MEPLNCNMWMNLFKKKEKYIYIYLSQCKLVVQCQDCPELGQEWTCLFNSLVPGRCGSNPKFPNSYQGYISCEIVIWWMPQDLNIGSANGWVPSDNKPLPEPVLTEISVPYDITRAQWVKSIKPIPAQFWHIHGNIVMYMYELHV